MRHNVSFFDNKYLQKHCTPLSLFTPAILYTNIWQGFHVEMHHVVPEGASNVRQVLSRCRKSIYGMRFPFSPAQPVTGHLPAGSAGDGSSLAGPSTHLYPYRFLLLIVLLLIGLYVLAGSGARAVGSSTPTTAQATALSASAPVRPRHHLGIQAGGGGGVSHPATAPAICLPTDLTCLLNQAAQWVAKAIFSVIQPIVDTIDQNSLNFITQTPPAGTYANATVMQFTTWSLSVVDAAVAVFVVIAGYNLMIARQIGASYQGIMEFLPRIALAVLAANLSLFFIRFFIDLENALCQGVTDLFGLTFLTNTIVGIFHGNLAGAGLLVFLLAMILGVMNLLLAGQMLLRLALLVLLMVLAPPAFLCWGLPQTQGYARLWSSTFAATVFVQFFQVAALALGAMLISYISAAHLLSLDSTVLTLLVSLAVLYLVLRIPGMLHVYALRPIAEAGPAALRAAQGTAEYVAGTAVRLVALA